NRHIDAHAERVSPGNDLQQSTLAELLDEQPVARQEAGMVQPDPVAQELLDVLTVRTAKAFTAQGLGKLLLLVLRAVVEAEQALRGLRGAPLRKIHDVNGSAILGDERLRRLLQKLLLVVEGERHRA